ncbi:histone-like nucleoid-structuring protein Lsr2 [Nocardia thraciensis]
MVRRVTVEMIDDCDAESVAAETVAFRLDGVAYEIDLSAVNADRLREHFAEWARHARKVRGKSSGKRSVVARSAAEKQQTQEIREWARRNGHSVSGRGRVATAIVEEYRRATA